jgi:GNAT superfamily N-acetyltransferase
MGFTGDFLSPRWQPAQAAEPLIVRVTHAHRDRIAQHFLRLEPEARFLRFGQHLRDESIAAYAAQIDLDFDDVFAVLDERLRIIALAHVSYSRDGIKSEAEFGVSVDAQARGRGLGFALIQRAIVHARWRVE